MIAFIWLIAAFTAVLILRFLFSALLLAVSRLLTGSAKLAKLIYAVFFFPGVIVHELSHFFSAAMLGVPTGKVEIFPKETSEGISLGSVKVAKTDLIRNAVIGAAPIIVGSLVLFSLLKVRFPYLFISPSLAVFSHIFLTSKDWIDILYFYLLFTVSNTMVLSKSDKQGLVPTILLGLAIVITTFVFSRSTINQEIIYTAATNIFSSLAVTFTLVGLVNLICLLPLVMAVKMLEKAKRKRVHFKLGL